MHRLGLRRFGTLFAVTLLALGVLAGPGVAHEEGEHDTPLHGHLFIQRPVIEFLVDGPAGTGVYATGFRKCVDLPVVPLQAHHAGIHTGRAGDALRDRAGHVVAPVAPYGRWESCAELASLLPVRLG